MSARNETRSDHHATVYRTGQHGCWSHCTCGWRSPTMTTAEGASVQFARHLASSTEETR